MHKSTIVFDDLCHTVTENNVARTVLSNVSGIWHQGCAIALRGVSGSGKTTLLSIIAGMRTPSSGRILYDGKPMYTTQQHSGENRVGYVFQEPLLIQIFSVLENVILKGLVAGTARTKAEDLGMELLARVHLTHKAHASPSQLSGGEQQRVAIARALYGNPSFLLLDEPTAHLDEIAKRSLLDLLLYMRTEHQYGIIIATHDIAVMSSMADTWELSAGSLTKVLPCNDPR